jgi:tol-pal system protein YbgF
LPFIGATLFFCFVFGACKLLIVNSMVRWRVSICDSLKSKDYDKAISAFTAFVANYPKSTLVANSYYWLGQLYYKKQQFKNAQQSFAEVVNNFSKSAKRSDAILKIGVIDETLGDVPSAKKAYNKVLKEYPNSSPAELAAKRLKELR